MAEQNAPTSRITSMINSSNNNNLRHHNYRKKKRTGKRQQSPSLTSKYQHIPPIIITDYQSYSQGEQQQEHLTMKNPLSWTKKWTKWFSSCGTERLSSQPNSQSRTVLSTNKRARTKSENDVSKRGSIEQDEKKKLSTTNSNSGLGEDSKENFDEQLSRQHRHHHQQSNEKVNNSNPVLYRDNNNRRYSNPFFTSQRSGLSRASIVGLSANNSQPRQSIQLTRSVDRLHHHRASRREIRFEEHEDYIPPPPLQSIQCHPTIEHYSKTLNQSNYFSSTHRRSQIEAYQLSSVNNRIVLPRPYSTSIPHSQSIQIMSKTFSDNNNNNKNNNYGLLSECHTPSSPLENSAVKAPRRIESNYSQFPLQPEPVYANTQSLYDNILYPQSTSKSLNRLNDQEKKSCASQTQLTWTMATFSSFVDLENQSVIIPQPDPNTLYSIVQHHQAYPPPSASPETIEQMKRVSPRLQYIDEPNASSHYQRPRTPISSASIVVEKRDGSFQTLLSIAPTQDITSNKQLFAHDSTPSPISAGSSNITGEQQRHHHHHHRKHKSRTSSSNNISTRDVGLQVNIQTVKKITFTSQKSDELSSLATTTSPSSPPTIKSPRELKNVQTNTEPLVAKRDISTSYESSLHLITSSSQTTESSSPPTTTTSSNANRQTKAAQTTSKTWRDQAIETNNLGLFVCDLSSLLKNGSDEPSSLNLKQKT